MNDMHSNLIKLAVSIKQLEDFANKKEKEGTLKYDLHFPGLLRENLDKENLTRHEKARIAQTFENNFPHMVPKKEIMNKKLHKKTMTTLTSDNLVSKLLKQSMEKMMAGDVGGEEKEFADSLVRASGMDKLTQEQKDETIRQLKEELEKSKSPARPGMGSQTLVGKAHHKHYDKIQKKTGIDLSSQFKAMPNFLGIIRDPKDVAYFEKNPKAKQALENVAKNTFLPKRSVAVVNSTIDQAGGHYSPEDRRAGRAFVAHHELSEANPKHARHGSIHARVKEGAGHMALQNVRDFNLVNTMNEAPNLQEKVRNLRSSEIDGLRGLTKERTQGIDALTRGLVGGQEGFNKRIDSHAKTLHAENTEHNNKVLSRVPERLHNHPAVQQRLRPTDDTTIRQIAEQKARKEGRLNRHQIKHLGNMLDSRVLRNPELVDELKGRASEADAMMDFFKGQRQEALKNYAKKALKKGRVR